MKPTKPIAPFIPTRTKLSWAALISLALVITFIGFQPPQPVQADSPNNVLTVQAEASQGFAAPGNSQPANLLVIVTDRSGNPVTDLEQDDFTVINHFGLPGQTCGFSNNIVSFGNIHTGAYQIKVALGVAGCTWVAGDYLAQVAINDGSRRGQAAVKLSVR